jgi:hypothetical protein
MVTPTEPVPVVVPPPGAGAGAGEGEGEPGDDAEPPPPPQAVSRPAIVRARRLLAAGIRERFIGRPPFLEVGTGVRGTR